MLEETILKRNYTPLKPPAKPPHPPSLWKNTTVFSITLYIVLGLYYFINRGMFNISIANRAFADEAIILIGLSFVLSSVCYFWNFADHFIIYRKQLGVVGFIYAVIHTLVIILYLNPIYTNLPSYLTQPYFLSYSLALAALLMYGGMVIISQQSVIHKIGGKLWRELLRVGYLAYIFSIIHYVMLDYDYWFQWFKGPTSWFPPFGFFTSVFGILVILMRLALMVHKLTHPINKPVPNAKSNNSKPL